MKKVYIVLMLGIGLAACNNSGSSALSTTGEPQLNNTVDSASYMLAMDYSSWLKNMGVEELNYELFAAAVKAQLNGDSIYIDRETGEQFLRRYYTNLEEAKTRKLEEQYADNYSEAMAWLNEKASEDGVKMLEEGLYYKVLTEGTGATPMPSDIVKVLYEGKFIDGTTFDKTDEEPMTYPVNRFITGWAKAMMQMPVGSKWELYISPDLAYGLKPDPRSPIPPQSALFFEVELLDIVDPATVQ